MESTELDHPLELEAKFPCANVFQSSKFLKATEPNEKEKSYIDTSSRKKEKTFDFPSLNSMSLKTNSPTQIRAVKSSHAEYGPLENVEVSMDKSIFLKNDDVSSKHDGIKSLDRTTFTHKNGTRSLKKKLKGGKINILTTVKNVNLAIKKLKSNTIFKSAKGITETQIEIVHDIAICPESTTKSKDEIKLLLAQSRAMRIYYRWKIYIKNNFFFLKARAFEQQMRRRLPIIEPDYKWKIWWDFMILFLFLCLFFVMGLQISFDLLLIEEIFKQNYTIQVLLQISLNLVLVLDIVFKFFTAFYQNGMLIRKPQEIVKNYFSSHFLYDFLAIIPIFLESIRIINQTEDDESQNSFKSFNLIIKFSQFLIFFKFFECVKALDILDDILRLEEKSQALFNLFKLIIEILLFSHFIACSWHAVASYSPYHETMLEVEDLYHKEWFSRYLTFLFWTISWEKLEPKNELEYGFGFFAVLASHAVFGFIIEGIHGIVESMGEKNVEMKRDIKIINKFMDKKNIGYDLQMKIRKYFYFMHEHKVANSQLESMVIGKLSSSLKEEVLLKAYGAILQSVPLFAENFSQKTIRELILAMNKIRFYPEENIFRQGDSSDHSLYIISEGEVDLFLENNDAGVRKVGPFIKAKKGEYFGERSFLTGCKRIYNAVSASFLTVYSIKREDFLRILSENNDDYEKFCEMRDKIMIYDDLEDLKRRCKSCNKRDHDVFTCPEIHYVPRKDFIIKRHLYSKPHLSREIYSRSPKKRQNALKIVNILQERLCFFEFAAKQEELAEDSHEEISESDLNDFPDSPALQSAQIKRRSVNDNFIKLATADNFGKILEEEKDKSVNFEEEGVQKKKKEGLNSGGDGKNGRRTSKQANQMIPPQAIPNPASNPNKEYKQMPSLRNLPTTGSLKFQQLSNTQWKEAFWETQFERMHIYMRYFSPNNADRILKNYDSILNKKIAKINRIKQIKRKKTILTSGSPKGKNKFSEFRGSKVNKIQGVVSEDRPILFNLEMKPDNSMNHLVEEKKKDEN